MQLDRLEVIIEAESKKANAELDRMISKLSQVSSALNKTTGFSFGTKGISSATTSMQGTLTSSRSLTSQLGRLAAGYYSVRKAVNFMNKSMEKSMDYVETVNLFQTSLKKIGMESAQDLGMEWGSETANAYAKTFIDRAENYNDMLVDSLTLDPNLMKNYQAVFAQMTNSMSLIPETSMDISETFTMLGNDIASLWNIDTDKAMKKLQSGLAGQIRPLRELGIDISKTSLEMYAMNYGIEDSVEKMSQAAKVQLRYLAIMEQAEVAFGDMAKTIESPSNQLRILSQQWNNLSRSIGNVFLPTVTTVLPYINGLVIALRSMTDALATAMGYELPDYSNSNIYKDLTGDIGDMENVIEDTTDANEKLKKSMLKWDELNILSKLKSGDKINLGSGYAQLDEAIRQKSDSYLAKFNEELSKMSNKTNDIAENIKKFFDRVGDKIEPTTKAFKKLWDEGLSKLAKYSWDNLKSFYNDFLSPIGTWVLGEGLPRLLEVGNGLLNSINWDKLSQSFQNLNKALAPFAISVGKGLIGFIETMGDILKPILATTSSLLAKGIDAIAKAIDKIPEDTAIAIGGAIGGIATSILLFKGATAIASIVKGIGGGIGGMLATISAHPVMAIATGITALAGAVLALNKAKFDKSDVGKYVIELDKLIESSKSFNDEVATMLANSSQRKSDIEAEYGAVSILADKYFDLADQTSLTNEEQALLKAYADQLIEKVPELSGLINEQTGAYKGTKEEIEALITKTKEYYLVQAAQESLIEIAKKQYEQEKLLKELETERGDVINLIDEKQKKLNETQGVGNTQLRTASDEQKEAQKQALALGGEITQLTKKSNELKKQIDTTKGSQAELSNEWDYATDYISTYSATAQREMPKVKTSVSNALKDIKTEMSNFKLPDITQTIKFQLDTSGIPSTGIDVIDLQKSKWLNNAKPYATGGFPEMGELFVAREAGPEMVGNIGGRTAVANNDQIVQAVSQGVAMAVASVMGSGGGKAQIIENIINLDGDVLARSLNKVNQSTNRRFNPVMQGG